MPSFSQQRETEEDWREFPAVERLPDNRIALTFDDGPDEDATPAVLEALEAAGIRATFFVVGEQLMRHHRVAREAAMAGHELALHGFAHPRHKDLFPPEAARRGGPGGGGVRGGRRGQAALLPPALRPVLRALVQGVLRPGPRACLLVGLGARL